MLCSLETVEGYFIKMQDSVLTWIKSTQLTQYTRNLKMLYLK